MRVERSDNGALVFGYLDTGSASSAEAYDTVLVRSAQPYRAELRPHRFGALPACDISGEARVDVLPGVSPRVRPDGHLLGLLLAGRGELEQSGRRAPLAPGDFVLYAGSRPFRLELEGPYRYFVLDLDPRVAGFLRRADGATANPQLPRTASGRILAAVLTEMAAVAPRMGPLTRQEMGEHVACLLRTLIRETGRPDVRASVFVRVLDYIDRNLGGELSPESIALAQHISVRHLHALFQRQDDTVGQHIRRRRLDRIRRDLADPDLAHLPAYAVAARWGICDPSHFGKLFRAEFGTSPHAFRRLTLSR